MPDRPGHFHRHRFPAQVISYAVWLYYRFALSHRDVEELLAERGIQVSYETVRRWAIKFGSLFAEELRRREARPVTPQQEEGIGRIRSSAGHLVGIIDQVLSFARSEQVLGPPRMDVVGVKTLLGEAAAVVEPLVREKGLVLHLDLPDEEAEIVTDPGMLRQIALNLCTNAVKFTEEGSVSLRAERENGSLVIEVSDTGIGIAPEHREKIFEPFWQADPSLTRRHGGTGLGLSVTRRLVAVLRGTISVESTPGDGATFTVRLPVHADAALEPLALD